MTPFLAPVQSRCTLLVLSPRSLQSFRLALSSPLLSPSLLPVLSLTQSRCPRSFHSTGRAIARRTCSESVKKSQADAAKEVCIYDGVRSGVGREGGVEGRRE